MCCATSAPTKRCGASTTATAGSETQAPAHVYRNVVLLGICQALFMCVTTMAIATTPLAGHALLGVDKTLATLPLMLYHAAIMAMTIPASLLMARVGRRGGFSLGAVLSILSGFLSAAAIFQQNFLWLCAGTALMGSSAAFSWYYRFAAADAANEAFRPKAISLVMTGGVLAGFLGPQTAKYAVDWFAPVMFAGVFAMVVVYAALSLLFIQGLRIPRLTRQERESGGRPMHIIVRQPAYIAAVASSMCGYGVMTLVMSSTPLAMFACGFNFDASATVIQAHVIGMFLPSFFTGHLIARFGVIKIISIGAFLQIGCAVINLLHIDFLNFFLANILVGAGWNFTYIGGSTLLTKTYRPEERAKVQASHDFMVYAMAATAAGLSGMLHANVGWNSVNLATLPMIMIILLVMLWLHRQRNSLKEPS
ncbi:MAG: MFS transporter [Pseudomonadota bacterium]